MHDADAAQAIAALAHEDRLRAFRLLVRHAPDGMRAGDLSKSLQIAPSSLTFHLGVLKRVGLVESRRVQRSIFYEAVTARMQSVLAYLMHDCCQGHPEVCGFHQEPDALLAGAESKPLNG